MKTYNIIDQNIDLIAGALGKLPFERVELLIKDLRSQWKAQCPPIPAPEVPPILPVPPAQAAAPLAMVPDEEANGHTDSV